MSFITVNFFAKSLLRPVTANVIMPTDKMVFPGAAAPAKKPYKTLYLLHGVFGNYTDWVNGTRIQAIANDHNLCVVMPCGDNKFYSNSTQSGDMYADFITHDLIEYIEETFNVSRSAEDRYIGGLSMGGFGAITNALRNPQLYSHVIMLSAALIKDQIVNSVNEPGRDIFTRKQYDVMFDLDDAADFEGSVCDYDKLAKDVASLSEGRKPGLKIYSACGTEDMLYARNVTYRDLLKAQGYDVTWVEGPGNHNWQFWDTYIEKAIEWLPLDEAVKGISSENVTKSE